eukprot:m.225622 g.225622  ORF g.225622 m.225622 type:complete len:200 (-) comp18783_c1_seq38:144-743(-)
MASYHFAKEVDDAVVTNLSTTERFPEETFQSFSGLVFSLLTQPGKAAQMLERIEEFGAEQGIKPSAFKEVVRAWLTFFRGAQKNNLTPKLVAEDLEAAGLSTEKARWMAKQYKENAVAMSRVVVGRTLMVNQLEDMEWKFGVAAGSSEVRTSGNTFLQMKLSLNKGSGSEDVFMELSLPQFYTFLQEMERAKASLEYLS